MSKYSVSRDCSCGFKSTSQAGVIVRMAFDSPAVLNVRNDHKVPTLVLLNPAVNAVWGQVKRSIWSPTNRVLQRQRRAEVGSKKLCSFFFFPIRRSASFEPWRRWIHYNRHSDPGLSEMTCRGGLELQAAEGMKHWWDITLSDPGFPTAAEVYDCSGSAWNQRRRQS